MSEEGDFVVGVGGDGLIVFIDSGHFEGVDGDGDGILYAFDEVVRLPRVHEESEVSEVESEDRIFLLSLIFEGSEHESVTPECDDNIA